MELVEILKSFVAFSEYINFNCTTPIAANTIEIMLLLFICTKRPLSSFYKETIEKLAPYTHYALTFRNVMNEIWNGLFIYKVLHAI